MCSDVTSGRQKVDTRRRCPIVIITSFVFETASSTDAILQTLDKARASKFFVKHHPPVFLPDITSHDPHVM